MVGKENSLRALASVDPIPDLKEEEVDRHKDTLTDSLQERGIGFCLGSRPRWDKSHPMRPGGMDSQIRVGSQRREMNLTIHLPPSGPPALPHRPAPFPPPEWCGFVQKPARQQVGLQDTCDHQGPKSDEEHPRNPQEPLLRQPAGDPLSPGDSQCRDTDQSQGRAQKDLPRHTVAGS